MKRSIALAILPFFCRLLVSCASFDAGNGAALYADKLTNDQTVYFVQVPANSNPQALADSITEQVARQVFIRNGVTARYSVTGGEDSPKKTSAQVDFNRGNLYALSGQLETLKTATTDNGVQALVRFRGNDVRKTVKLPTMKPFGKNGNPDWVTNPPSGLAFYASAEASSARSGSSEGFQNADTMAFASLARFLAKETVSGSTKTYYATFAGAFIARRWYNPATNTYYSLAVVPRPTGSSAK